MPPFGANDPGPRLRSTVVEGDGSEDVGFDNIDSDELSQSKPKTVPLPAKRSFFGLGRLLQSRNVEATIIEPEKKPIRCFECGHIHEVSVAATSTQCARCSLYISLSDQNIREQYSRNIRTRGNVTIHKKGSVVGCEIACHNLTVLGGISGSVDCSGNATFKNSGKVLGSMHCKHIVIEKKCEMDFPQGIIAESADIYGVVRGDILCSGTIHIFKTGSVLGDATAKAIVMKDGGVLTGQMNIQQDVNISLPEKGTARREQNEAPVEQAQNKPEKKSVESKAPTGKAVVRQQTAEKKTPTQKKTVEKKERALEPEAVAEEPKPPTSGNNETPKTTGKTTLSADKKSEKIPPNKS